MTNGHGDWTEGLMRPVSQQLHTALDRVDAASSGGAPPDDATARALSSLALAEGAVRDAGGDRAPVAPATSRHAEALALLAMAAAGRTAVDDRVLEGAQDLTAVWARAFLLLPPGVLAGPVRAHVDRLTVLRDASLTPASRARLGSLIGDAAAFAGCLAMHLHRNGEAHAWYTLARDAASDAGDPVVQACALEGLGSVCSTASTAGQGGDAGVARALACQAAAALPDDAPGTVRAWIAFREAVEHAVAGDAMGCHRSIDRAETALAGVRRAASPRHGFLSDEGRFRLCLHPEFSSSQRGWSLMQLSSPAAVPLLRRSAEAPDPVLRGGAQADLAELFARRDHRDEAVSWAAAALGTAEDFRYPYGVHIVRSIRRLMDAWEPLGALRDLDDRLAAA